MAVLITIRSAALPHQPTRTGKVEYKNPDATGNLYKTIDRADRVYGNGGKLLKDDKWYYLYDAEGNLELKSKRNINGAISPKKTIAPLIKRSKWVILDTDLPDGEIVVEALPDSELDRPTWQMGDWKYYWYGNGMLKTVLTSEGKKIHFEYDALGRRTAKIAGNTITRFIWDGNVILHEWSYDLKDRPKLVVDETGRLGYDKQEIVGEGLVTWVYDRGSLVPSAKIENNQAYSIVSDYIGRPVQAYNSIGKLVWEYEYDIYGKLKNIKGLKKFVPFRQLGQYEDEELDGLYYNRFRYYDIAGGMYISQDPIGIDGGLRLYEYVKNTNTQLDPLGLQTVTVIYNHILKPNKVTDIKELNRQMKEQIKAMNNILKNEGIDGLKDRVSNYNSDLEKEGRAYTQSLGSAGENKVWAHTPDMKTGGLPIDVSKIPAGARENSILGGGNAQRISEEILNMGDGVTKIKGKIVYK